MLTPCTPPPHTHAQDSIAAFSEPGLYAKLPLKSMYFFRLCTAVMNGLNFFWFSKMVSIAAGSLGGGKGKSKKAGGEGRPVVKVD